MTRPPDVAAPVRIDLGGGGWMVRPFIGDEWLQHRAHLPGRVDATRWWQADVPGSIVTDAARAGAVPDPYRGLNSRAAEWIADRTLVYRREFTAADPPPDGRAVLTLEGLDYSGRVFCDGTDLGRHEGQFTPFTADVTALLAGGGEHLLAVVVDPAPASEPQVGRTSRVRVAKTRMSYGWDFCPRLVHQGIWRPVHLDLTGPASVSDVRLLTAASEDRVWGPWSMSVRVTVGTARPANCRIDCDLTVLAPDGSRIAGMTGAPVLERSRGAPAQGATGAATAGTWSADLTLADPQLWSPNGFGDRPMYRAVVTVYADGSVSDRREVPFGLRTLGFRQVADAAPGSLPYLPVVNGIPIPVRGWNWVPADLGYGAVPPDRIRHLVRLAADSGATVMRVWGGGLLESDDFYRACDDAGILVWQEFIQSSSGIESTPSDDPEFVHRLVTESAIAVRARRHHPSLAIWCGGNELAGGDGCPLDATHPALEALQEMVHRLDPGRLFLPTSPSGPVFSNEPVDQPVPEPAIGGGYRDQHDVHGPWEHQGLRRHYARYDAASCQLLSEFGVEGMAYSRVLDHVVGAADVTVPTRGTELWDHLGRWWNNEDLVRAAFGGAIRDVDQLSRCSQFLQADGLRYAVQAQRRRWPSCAGTIVWQLDEPFPNAWCTSAVDHSGAPKPAYHAVADAYRPLLACAQLPSQTFDGHPGFGAELALVCDDRRQPDAGDRLAAAIGSRATVTARARDLYGTVLATREATVAAVPGAPAPAGSMWTPFDGAHTSAVLLTVGAVTDRRELPAHRSRYLVTAAADLAELLALPPARLRVTTDSGDGDGPWELRLRNTGPVAAVFVRLMDARPYGSPGWMLPSDSGFHLLPGEEWAVTVRWDRVPPAERRLRLDGFNVEAITVAADAPGNRP